MFDQYEEIKNLMPLVPLLKQAHRASGIAEMEETLQEKLRSLQFPLLVAEDDGNGFFNLEVRNLDNAYYTIYIVGKPKLADSASRKQTLLECRMAALQLFKQMKKKAVNFADPFYGADFSKIDYQQIGPIATGLHGYSFSYVLKDENFPLEAPSIEP